MKSFASLLVASLAIVAPVAAASAAPADRAADIRARLLDPAGGIIVVAHRGCHAPVRDHADPTPENSLAALDRCVAIGADMMETDVRRAGDGTLVMIHDATVDRTTDGKGVVAELTWPELRRLRLRNDLGQPGQPLTSERMATLDEMLARARGRIMLNLDVKAAIYPQVAAAVLRAGMERQIVIKTEVGSATPAMAALPPFDRLMYMPVLLNPHGDADLGAIAARQLDGAHPVGVELPHMAAAQLAPVVAVARAHGVRVWDNTLWEGFVAGYGGDADAVRDPAAIWGRLFRDGVSILQTDAPEALVRYRATL